MEMVKKLQSGDPSSSPNIEAVPSSLPNIETAPSSSPNIEAVSSSLPNREAVVPQEGPADASTVGSLTGSTSGAEAGSSTSDKEPLGNGLEIIEKPPKEYAKLLSGGAKKRFWWHIKNGYSPLEAYELSLKPGWKWAAEKRNRSAISTQEENSKRPRVEGQNGSENSSTTFRQICNGIEIGIVANDFPETFLRMEQQRAIQENILNKVEESGADISPQFHNSTFMSGFLLINCDGEATATWLKSIIEELKPWEEASLRAVEGDNIPQSIIMTGFFPHSFGDKNERIIALIKSQNKQLEIEKWTLLKREDQANSTLMVFFIDEHSEEVLKLNNFNVNYKFGKVKLSKNERLSLRNISITVDGALEEFDTPSTSQHNRGKRFFKNARYGRGNIYNRLGDPTKFSN